jgi:hypothetical protein
MVSRTYGVQSRSPSPESPEYRSARNAGSSLGRTLAGFVRDVCRIVPPLRSMVRTERGSSGIMQAATESGSSG